MDGKWGRIPERQGPGAVKSERQLGPALAAMLSHAEKDHALCRRGIINNSLTKPEQFERSPANSKPAWLFLSQVSGRDGRDDITGVPHENPSCSERCRRHSRVL